MADKSPPAGSFDLERVRELIEMMEKHGVTEVNLRKAEERWVLRRGPAEVINMMAPGGYAPPAPNYAPPAVHHAPAPQAAAPSAPAAASAAADGLVIKSPTVGTFYASPTPGEPTFVKVGSTVKPDTVVCIIEAMKVFNQIPSEISGTITEVLVNNGDAVEYGQPLFRVKP
ncbi:MAG: acetyl-CoA carboxylase biotin carboxyl carrier protein [Planctomycetes bacterium]|nr:acetyl-CoA carboxylase biotin carboxyl carrier protein [Planctomycetota bacterium]